MPHCILEHSANVLDTPDWQPLLGRIHEALAATGQFQLADVKSRVIRHELFRVGSGVPENSFVSLTLQILDGRSDQIKLEVSTMLLEILRQAFPRSLAEQACSVAVQIVDIHRPSYMRC